MADVYWYPQTPHYDSHRRMPGCPLQVQTQSFFSTENALNVRRRISVEGQWTESSNQPLTPELSPSYSSGPYSNDGTCSLPPTPAVDGDQNYYEISNAYLPAYVLRQSPRYEMPSPQYPKGVCNESFSQASNGHSSQELSKQSRFCPPTYHMPEPQIMISSPPPDQQYSQQHQYNGYGCQSMYNQTPSLNALSPEDAHQFIPCYPYDNYPQSGFQQQQSPRSWERCPTVNRSRSRSNCRRRPSHSPRRSPSPSFYSFNPSYSPPFAASPQPSSAPFVHTSDLGWGTDESQSWPHTAPIMRPEHLQWRQDAAFVDLSIRQGNNTPAETQKTLEDAPRIRKKALLIGINYLESVPTTKLKGCINDAKFMKRLLLNYGYQEEDIVTLVDDSEDRNLHPTHDNIIREMRHLVGDAKPGDYHFFHYSGHGDQITDTSGDELSGKDQRIIPSDYYLGEHKYIIDDDLHKILVGSLPAGCRLTAVFDACHSGTALDLPYVYPENEGGNQKGVHETTSANVISWSACKDEEKGSDDVNSDGEDVGAMCSVFIECLKDKKPLTYRDLYSSLGDKLKDRNPEQHPQLSSSHQIIESQIFEF